MDGCARVSQGETLPGQRGGNLGAVGFRQNGIQGPSRVRESVPGLVVHRVLTIGRTEEVAGNPHKSRRGRETQG